MHGVSIFREKISMHNETFERRQAQLNLGVATSIEMWKRTLGSLSETERQALISDPKRLLSSLDAAYGFSKQLSQPETEMVNLITASFKKNTPATEAEAQQIIEAILAGSGDFKSTEKQSPFFTYVLSLIVAAVLIMQPAFSKDTHAATPTPTATMTPESDATSKPKEVQLPTAIPTPTIETTSPISATESSELSPNAIVVVAEKASPYTSPLASSKVITDVVVTKGMELTPLGRVGTFVVVEIEGKNHWFNVPELLATDTQTGTTQLTEPEEVAEESEIIPETKIVTIINNNTNIRESHTTQSEVAKVAQAGEIFTVSDSESTYFDGTHVWYKIVLIEFPDEPARNKYGWIRSDLVLYSVTAETISGGIGGPIESESTSVDLAKPRRTDQVMMQALQQNIDKYVIAKGINLDWDEELQLYVVEEENKGPFKKVLIPQAGSDGSEEADIAGSIFALGDTATLSTTITQENDPSKSVVHSINFLVPPEFPRSNDGSITDPTFFTIFTVDEADREKLAAALSAALAIDPTKNAQVYIALSDQQKPDNSDNFKRRFREVDTYFTTNNDSWIRFYNYAMPNEDPVIVITAHIDLAVMDRFFDNPEFTQYLGHGMISFLLNRIVRNSPYIDKEIRTSFSRSSDAEDEYMLKTYVNLLHELYERNSSSGTFVPVINFNQIIAD